MRLRVAVGQFAAGPSVATNAKTCINLMEQASAGGADLLVLPEGVHARFTSAPSMTEHLSSDQPISGEFVTELLEASRGSSLTTVVGTKGLVNGTRRNTLAVVRDGELVCSYDKLHVMDAFEWRESDVIHASDNSPVLFDVGGFRVGLMICYDLRFPELARLLALAGADLIAVPAAWVAGPQKERHWQTLVAARALENTCYVAASGECGPRNVGCSMVVDPMGVVTGQLGHEPGLVWAMADKDYLAYVRRQLPVLVNSRFRVDSAVQPNPRDYVAEPMPDLAELVARGEVVPEP